jgi:Mg-chelatase subunit ChlI
MCITFDWIVFAQTISQSINGLPLRVQSTALIKCVAVCREAPQTPSRQILFASATNVSQPLDFIPSPPKTESTAANSKSKLRSRHRNSSPSLSSSTFSDSDNDDKSKSEHSSHKKLKHSKKERDDRRDEKKRKRHKSKDDKSDKRSKKKEKEKRHRRDEEKCKDSQRERLREERLKREALERTKMVSMFSATRSAPSFEEELRKRDQQSQQYSSMSTYAHFTGGEIRVRK